MAYSNFSRAWFELGPSAVSRAQPLPRGGIFWLHIPKCGTSFLAVLAEAACPRMTNKTRWMVSQPYYQGWHIKEALADKWQIQCDVPFLNQNFYHQRYNEDFRGHGFAMFRDPLLRIISGYHFNLHRTDHVAREAVMEAKVNHTGDPLLIYAFRKGAPGLQTKFLLNWTYTINDDHDRPLKTADTKMAMRALYDLAFVGITDEWAASIVLFHGMYGGNLDKSVEFDNVRNRNYTKSKLDSDIRTLRDAGWRDPFDEPVFDVVKNIMTERVRDTFEATCTVRPANTICRHFVERGFLSAPRRLTQAECESG